MFDTDFPKPKHIQTRGGSVPLPLVLSPAPLFEKAAYAFAAYIKERFGVHLNTVAGRSEGIRLCAEAGFPEEGYRISSSAAGVVLISSTAKGMNRALSTLFQMTKRENGVPRIPCVEIEDEPDAPYRGLMIDLSSAWHAPSLLFRYVDLCWKCRASHLQLHLTDNRLFTLPLTSFPRLPNAPYDPADLARLVEYAESRGIVLVPEVDIPGHTAPWGKAYPELFGSAKVLAASEEVFDALRQIFREVHAMFPHSPWIHIGGDEAETGEWEKCPITRAYMERHNIKSVGEMYAEYIRTAAEIILELGCTPVVWEGFAKEYNDRIPKQTVVIAWESLYQVPQDLAAGGFTLINCSWEPLYICTNDRFWQPEDILKWNLWTWRNWWERSHAYPDGITLPRESARVIGGQICVWGTFAAKSENPEAYLEQEYQLTAERMPALCERTWNV